MDPSPADAILVRHDSAAADAIGFGEAALTITQPELKGFTWATHVAFSRPAQNGQPMVSEMGFKGYERRPLADYAHFLYCVAHFDVTDEQRTAAVLADEAMAGIDYGWSEYLPFIIDGMTGGKIDGTWGNHIICSTHVILACMALGLFPEVLATAAAPCHFAKWVGAFHV